MIKLIAALLVPCLLIQLYGCHSMQSISRDSLPNVNENPRLLVLTTDGSQIEFQEDKYTITSDTLQGEGIELSKKKGAQSKSFTGKIPLADIKQASTEQFNIGGTLLLAGIVVGLLVLLITYDPIKAD